MSRYIINPFFIYIFIFLVVLIFYPLKWSYLQPDLTLNLISFVVTTFLIGLIFLIIFSKIKIVKKIEKTDNKFVWFMFLFGSFLEFLYQGAIPFFEIMTGKDFKYNLFGIPTFHVFFLPYVSAVGVFSLYKFLINKEKQRLYIYIFSLLYCLLIFNRGAILFILISSVFLYIQIYGFFNLKKIILSILIMPLILYIFGYMGNYRMASSGYSSDEIILTVGRATPNFLNSKIPNEFLWSYLYLVTPYANLQYQLDSTSSNVNYIEVFKTQILLDAIQKRIYVDENFSNNLITDEFNVSTMYGKPVQVSGIFGAYVLFFYFIIVIFILTLLSPKRYRIVILSILCSVTVFTAFTNTLVFSGFILQPILIILLCKMRFNKISLI